MFWVDEWNNVHIWHIASQLITNIKSHGVKLSCQSVTVILEEI